MKPKILLATTCRWFPTARLAMALASAGCHVEAVCPSGHPVDSTSAVSRTYKYLGLAPLRSFSRAIAAAKPDMLIPGDDLATSHLQQLYGSEQNSGHARELRRLIEHSLGAPESFPIVRSRSAFIALAQAEGVRAPRSGLISTRDDLRTWIAKAGLPTVLKADGTSGGDGVQIVRSEEAAERAFGGLQAPPLLARAAKRAVLDRDGTLLWPSLLRRKAMVSAQAFISGREATSTVACWKGKVLAALHFEVVKKTSATGHATVVRISENGDMAEAVEKMVRRLKLSGLYGFDFMLESATGQAYLIEINPRSTQVGHLDLGPGRNLPAAMFETLSGKEPRAERVASDRETHPKTDRVMHHDTVALFPQEWIRDPQSSYLDSAYHDVPWQEPEFVRRCVNRRRQQSAWYAPAHQTSSSALAEGADETQVATAQIRRAESQSEAESSYQTKMAESSFSR